MSACNCPCPECGPGITATSDHPMMHVAGVRYHAGAMDAAQAQLRETTKAMRVLQADLDAAQDEIERKIADIEALRERLEWRPMSTWRTGRKVGHHLYEQRGPEPSDDDPPIGTMFTPELAAEAVRGHNRMGVAQPPTTASTLRIHSPGVHLRFPDDGVDYCGWHGDGGIYDGCGESWPCSSVRSGGAVSAHESIEDAEARRYSEYMTTQPDLGE